ncbi:hypothetical protein AXG93_2024s1250 [Marchantia polymorpha subsp. ruderalis]|uniref:Uncharacterized protein n=1 Tax=Marchantia polymorpha subsp. ruderalis TaxID=1480154 RepID=A0A176VL15_MARPO|nr:hypothetical protein AXG93_2024s1250 [Marchantia polymorpha subsp. ruderalis]
MNAMERCLPSEQVPFDDSPLGQGTSAQAPSAQAPSAEERFREEPSAQGPSAQKSLEQVAAGKDADGETRVPSAQAPSAIAVRAGVAGPSGAGSPTPLEVLAGHGVEAAVEEATRSCARESPRISAATEILDTEDDTSSEEEEVESVRELVRNRTRIKVATNPELMALDQKYRQLEECYNFLQDQCTLSRKLQKTAIQLRNELSEAARKADEELLGRLQSQCDELRAQRAEAELQLAEVEGHNRRATDRTREELVSRVDRCLRGYARWEIAVRERMTLREMEIRATALMSGDSRSRRRVAKRLESFLSRSRDAIANLEAEVTEVLRRLGLRRRADEWTGRELVSCRPSHRRHSR